MVLLVVVLLIVPLLVTAVWTRLNRSDRIPLHAREADVVPVAEGVELFSKDGRPLARFLRLGREDEADKIMIQERGADPTPPGDNHA